jgi:GNAT superfamily N-acetyltransferase
VAAPRVRRAGIGRKPQIQDAGTLQIRPISPDDRQQFVDAFERLSDSSRYRRFLTARHGLSAAEVGYFTEVDHHNHEALFAVDPESGAGIGVARYVRSESDRCVAELAVAVVDDWQGQGVGGRLTAALADRARAEGITSFTALVLADNKPALNLLDELGRVRIVRLEFGTVELTVDLPERGLGHVARLLRAVAQGDIKALGHARSAPE